jgi:hypothetical protein
MNIEVTVIKNVNENNRYTPDGCKAMVDCNSTTIIGKRYLASTEFNQGSVKDVKEGDEVSADHLVSKTEVLKIHNENKGTLYIEETQSEFIDLCQACCIATTTTTSTTTAP